MLGIQDLTYHHPNRDVLFENITLHIKSGQKIALIGNNGTGKSTLLRLIAGELKPVSGLIKTDALPFYLPQHFGQFDHYSVAEAMGVKQKLDALRRIVDGELSEKYLLALNDDWLIEERCLAALQYWKLNNIRLDSSMSALSGGQKTKVFLAAIQVHDPAIIVMDEPTNHLDTIGRQVLYQFINSHPGTFVIVSHDRTLLNRLDFVCELTREGIKSYGGNYDFYVAQKTLERNALDQELKSAEKTVRKAKIVSRETQERQQKLDARGKKKQEKAGVPTIMMNTLRNNAEKTGSRLRTAHTEKIEKLTDDLQDLRNKVPDADQMKLDFDKSALHFGKILFEGQGLNVGYEHGLLWKNNLNLEIESGDRVAINGSNGSGKTTLIKIILGEIKPDTGDITRRVFHFIYIDQDYSLVDNSLSVFQQSEKFNDEHLPEHELKIRLTRFLFDRDDWDKNCSALSGGEKMRLALCCLSIANKAPDMIILDEPTNNLDIQNLEILGTAVSSYKGTLLVVSHDTYFLEQIGISKTIDLDNG